jgi:hypothetical protein
VGSKGHTHENVRNVDVGPVEINTHLSDLKIIVQRAEYQHTPDLIFTMSRSDTMPHTAKSSHWHKFDGSIYSTEKLKCMHSTNSLTKTSSHMSLEIVGNIMSVVQPISLYGCTILYKHENKII